MTKQRSSLWKWYLCGLLLLATTINYMDRQTLSLAGQRITEEFKLSDAQFGIFEWVFGWSFAVGSVVFGFLADRMRVYWLYPVVLLGWSLMGVLSGCTQDFPQLLVCRGFLGFFEAGHWPCALKTTFVLLSAKERTMGKQRPAKRRLHRRFDHRTARALAFDDRHGLLAFCLHGGRWCRPACGSSCGFSPCGVPTWTSQW